MVGKVAHPTGIMIKELKGILSNWNLLWSLVKKELIIRYKGSVLGFLWSLLTPLFLMVVYSFVFGYIFQKFEMKNYSIYLLVGLLPWTFFSISLSNSVTCFLTNGGLITKVYFPRSLVPVSIVLAQAVHFFLSLIPLAGFMLFFHIDFSWKIILLPVVILIHIIMTCGIAMLLSSLFIFFRDIQQLMETILLTWFFVSPIIYPVSMIQERHLVWTFLKWNPLNCFLELYHGILYFPTYGNPPLHLETFLAAGFSAIFFFVLGLFVLTRKEAEMIKAL